MICRAEYAVRLENGFHAALHNADGRKTEGKVHSRAFIGLADTSSARSAAHTSRFCVVNTPTGSGISSPAAGFRAVVVVDAIGLAMMASKYASNCALGTACKGGGQCDDAKYQQWYTRGI